MGYEVVHKIALKECPPPSSPQQSLANYIMLSLPMEVGVGVGS